MGFATFSKTMQNMQRLERTQCGTSRKGFSVTRCTMRHRRCRGGKLSAVRLMTTRFVHLQKMRPSRRLTKITVKSRDESRGPSTIRHLAVIRSLLAQSKDTRRVNSTSSDRGLGGSLDQLQKEGVAGSSRLLPDKNHWVVVQIRVPLGARIIRVYRGPKNGTLI